MKRKLTIMLLGLVSSAVAFAQWTEQATGFTTVSRGIEYISAVDQNVVWATAYNGTTPSNYITEFTRTTNGGTTWTPGTVAGYTSGYGSSMIIGIDGQTAWMPVWSTSGGGAILKTINGGTSWTAQTTAAFAAPAGFPNVVHFWDANTGWCQGDPNGGYFELYTTTNGGTTWTRVPTGNIPPPIAGDEYGTTGFYDVVGDTVWFTTNKGRVFRSPDKGLNWTVVATTLTNQCKIAFKDALNGLVYQVDNGILIGTSDGGDTWTTINPTGNFYTSDIAYVPGTPNTYVSTGSSDGASFSLYGGQVWEDFASVPGQMLSCDWVSNTCGWVGNFNTSATVGGIFKFTGTIPNPANNDLGVMQIISPVSGLANAAVSMQFKVMNYGTQPQSSFDVSYTIDGGAVVTESVSQTIAPGGSYTHTFAATEDFSTVGAYVIHAYATLTGDENTSNDGITETVYYMNWLPTKRVFAEEATGTWCGWCVRGHVYLDYMDANYPDTWIGVAVHNGDPMTVTDYDTYIGGFISGYPSGLVDRGATEKDPLEFEDAYNERITEVPFASVNIENIDYNTGTRVLNFDVVAKFAIPMTTANYRLNAIVAESNVTGTAAGWEQANYYAGGGYGVMGGYETKPDPVPAAQMVYKHVARALLGGWDGTASTVTATVAENEEFSYSYSYTLPAGYNPSTIEIIGLIIDQGTDEVMNANVGSIATAVETAMNEDMAVYPNPSTGMIYVNNVNNANIVVYNIMGETVASFSNVSSSVSINLGEQTNGVYIVKITEDNVTKTSRIIISK
ncbi:MAG: T9SS type A sorting domain-containing protein [Bacteroidetes bacterium]|nr:T9SS type A sorting domain-containing protein [Bacteroidota bacterium]MBU1720874.1 T9SS type A sorting domain-containing protein [Bacteroidota bacterium]